MCGIDNLGENLAGPNPSSSALHLGDEVDLEDPMLIRFIRDQHQSVPEGITLTQSVRIELLYEELECHQVWRGLGT